MARRSIMDMYVDYLTPDERQELARECERSIARQNAFIKWGIIVSLAGIVLSLALM